MTYMNMISVVVCTYNQEKTIAKTLDSILRQKCSWPIEILIGEDCSSDHTLQICQEYAQRYPDTIRLFANQYNKGLLDNYYDCLLQVRGKYIADLAGDDEWCDPCKLESQRLLLEEHPDVVLVHTDYRLRDEASGQLHFPPYTQYPLKYMDGKQLTVPILTQTRRPVVHLCTAMYRTEAFQKCYEKYTDLFRNHLYPCEDLQLCALLSRMGRFAYINNISLNYSAGVSISKTKDEANQFDFVRRCTQLTYDLQQRLQIPMDKRMQDFYCYRIFAMLMHAFRAHDPSLREETRKYAQQWQVHQEFRTSAVAFLTSNDLLWRISLFLRKQLFKLHRN